MPTHSSAFVYMTLQEIKWKANEHAYTSCEEIETPWPIGQWINWKMKGEKLNSLQNISFENANVIVNMTYLFRK